MKKVLIIAGDDDYKRLFIFLGFEVVQELHKADLVCFTGGQDVTPKLYGDKKHAYTYNSFHRDESEALIFHKAKHLGIPCVGICRGAQFLNVMSGGRMYQHVAGHTVGHTITDTQSGEQVYVSSTHHQMMLPGEDAEIIATGNQKGRREWYDGEIFKSDISDKDVEVVFYEGTQSLCFQPHPEFSSVEYLGMRKYFAELLDRFFSFTKQAVAA